MRVLTEKELMLLSGRQTTRKGKHLNGWDQTVVYRACMNVGRHQRHDWWIGFGR